MNKKCLLIKSLATVVLTIFSTMFIYAGYKSEAEYEIVADILTVAGGVDVSSGEYVNDSCHLFPSGTTTYLVVESTDIYSGWAAAINNLPVVSLLEPQDDVWLNYSTPTFKWSYLDYDGHPQSGFELQLSTSADFSLLNYSFIVESEDTEYFAGDIASGIYYWRLRAKDKYWNEYSAWSSTYVVKIDTIAPVGHEIVSIIAYSTYCIVEWSAAEDIDVYGNPGVGLASLPYVLRYSTSPNFEPYITTTTVYMAQTSTQTLVLRPNTTYYFQVKAVDELGNERWSNVVTKVTLCTKPASVVWDTKTNISITISWSDTEEPPNPTGTIYAVELSSYNDFSIIISSVGKRENLYLRVSGLSPNTTYYARVVAYNWEGVGVASVLEPSWAATLCSLPNNVEWTTEITTYSIKVSWAESSPDNPAETIYIVELSTASDFSGYIYSSSTVHAQRSAVVIGLTPNTTYYGRVKAVNWDGIEAVSYVLTPYETKVTSANIPSLAAVVFSDVTNTQITVHWSNNNNPLYVTKYELDVSSYSMFDVYDRFTTYDLQLTVSDLHPNTTYYFRVRAVSHEGVETPYLYLGNKSTLANTPDELNFSLVTATRIDVSWGTGGNPDNVTKYHLQVSTTAVFIGNVSEHYTYSTSISTTGLSPNTTYYFRIRAINHEEIPTVWVSTKTKVSLTSEPGSVSWGTITNTTMVLSWGASSPDNPPETIYIAQVSTVADFSSGIIYSSQTTRGRGSATISSLTPATTYYGRVIARNWEGVDVFAYALPNARVTRPSLPAGLLWGDVTNTTLEVRWGASSPDNPPECVYIVELSTISDFSGIIMSSQTTRASLSATVSGLTPNTTYYGRVKAVNWENYAATSILSDPYVTLCSTPNADWYSITKDTAVIIWFASEPDNPLDTIYIVHLSTTENFVYGSYQSTVTTRLAGSVTFYNLIPNTTYWFRVIARNRNGVDTVFVHPESRISGVQTPVALPFSDITNTNIRANWSANANPSGTEYIVQKSTWGSFTGTVIEVITTQLYYDFSDLMPNNTYWFRVRARNIAGEVSDWCYLGSTVTFCSLPQGLTYVEVSTQTIKISWSNSEPDNPEDTIYVVEVSTSADFTGHIYSSSTVHSQQSAVVSNLTPNTTYYARVAAVNHLGVRSVQEISESTVTLVNPPVFLPFDEITNTSIRVNWGNNNNPLYVTKYNIQVSSWSGWTGDFTEGFTYELNFTTSNILPNHEYYFRVRAINHAGTPSEWVVLGSTYTRASPPSNLVWEEITTTTIRVSWAASEPDNPADTVYIVELSTISDFSGYIYSSSTVHSQQSAVVSGLTPNTTYYGRVVAVNQLGLREISNLSGWKATLCSLPEGVSWSEVSTYSITVLWSVSEPDNPAETIYRVELSTASDFSGYIYSSATVHAQRSAVVIGLTPNTTYYGRVIAVNWENIASTTIISTPKVTLANPPVFISYSDVTNTQITVNWSENSNPLNVTKYVCEVSSISTFSEIISSSVTYNLYFTVDNLQPNTTYYFRVKAINHEEVATNWVEFPTKVTLCSEPDNVGWGSVAENAVDVYYGAGSPPNPSNTIYRVELSTKVEFDVITASVESTCGANGVTIHGLTPNTTYYARVIAINWENIASTTAVSSAKVTLARIPIFSAYTIITSSSITVEWEPNNNPLYVTRYECEVSSTIPFTVFISTLTYNLYFTAENLRPNTTYYLRARAINHEGVETSWVDFPSTYTICAVAGELVFVFVSTDVIQLSFTDDNNPEYTVYELFASTATNDTYAVVGVRTGVGEFTHSGLLPNVTYYYKLAAKNIAGVRTFGQEYSTYTLCNIPGTPQFDVVTSSRIVILWSANNNSDSTIYILEASSRTNTNYTEIYRGRELSFTHTNLPPNTTFYYRLKAVNLSNIHTEYTQEVSTRTKIVSPGEITIVSVSTDTVTVSWQRGDLPEGTLYQLEESQDGINYTILITTTQTYYIHKNLQPNTTHFYRVATKSEEENLISDYSGPTSTYTLANIPSNFIFTVVTSSSIGLMWDTNNNSGSTIYEVECSTNNPYEFGVVYIGYENTFVHRGLITNTTYYYRVRAKNLAGIYTDYTTTISTITVPQQVQNLVVVNVSTYTIMYSWESVEGATRYNIYSTTTSLPIATTTLTEYLLTGLTPNTSYTIQVSAVGLYNQEGPKSLPVSTYTHAETPLEVSLLEATTWTLKVEINTMNNPYWTKYAIKFSRTDTGQTKYVQPDYTLADTEVYQTTTTWANIVVKGLAENVQYRVTAIAENEVGVRTVESPANQRYTLLNSPKLTDITIIPQHNSITIFVSSPPNYLSGDTGSEFECVIGVDAGGTSSGYLLRRYDYTDDGLMENTEYGYKVRYYNGDGIPTEFSDTISVYTLVSPPSMFTITAISSSSLKLETNRFSNDNVGSSGYLFSPVLPSAEGATPSGWIQTNTYIDDGLLPNTTYVYTVKFRNANAVETSTLTAVGCTLAEEPSAPQIISVSTTTIQFSFNAASNPSWTEYSIKVLLNNNTYYLQTDNTVGDTEVFTTTWQPNQVIDIVGLLPDREYQISVNARNLFGEISYGVSTTTRTYAETPGPVYLTDVSTTSIRVIIDPRNNSNDTTYSIKCINLDEGVTKYVKADGLLGDEEVFLSYTSWGAENGIVVFGLYPSYSYEFSVRARNGYGNLTEYSLSVSTSTLGVLPKIYVVNVSTSTVELRIEPNGLPPKTQFAIKNIVYGTTYYVDIDGYMVGEASWAVYSVWTETITVKNLLPNHKYDFYLGVKNVLDVVIYDFNIRTSTYTLAEQPEIELYEVTTDTVVVKVNTKNNPYWTEYSVKCIIDGTTYYLQSDYTVGDTVVWQTTTTWKEFSVLVSTPNFPVDVYVQARNGALIPTEYSNSVSTWTALAVPEAPTVIGCYDYIQLTGQTEPSYQYFTRIFINSRNSKYTQYCIVFAGVEGKYLTDDGSGKLTSTKKFLTKDEWYDNKNINNADAAGKELEPDKNYRYQIIARSIARAEETQPSNEGSAKIPNPQLFTISVSEKDNDFIQIDYQAIDPKTGVTRYDVLIFTSDNKLVSISTLPATTTSFQHDIDGSTPTVPSGINTELMADSIKISWTPVPNPVASTLYKYIVEAKAEIQSSTYTIIRSTISRGISVSPIIKYYKLYTPTTYFVIVATQTEITIEKLKLNTTHTFWLSAVSSDDLESDKVKIEVYLEYPEEPVKLTDVNLGARRVYNGILVGVDKQPQIYLQFNKFIDIKQIRQQNNIYIKLIRDNKNNYYTDRVVLSTFTTLVDRSSFVVLTAELEYGHRYQIIISSVVDLIGNIISDVIEFETMYNLNVENKIVPKTTTYVEIVTPAGLLDKRSYIVVNEDERNNEVETANSKLDYDKTLLKIIRVDFYDENNSKIKEFDNYLTLTIGYSDEDNDGYVDEPYIGAKKIKVDSLSIWKLDETRRAYMKLPTMIDKLNKRLIAKVKHLSIFAIIGSMNLSTVDVKVYPVPWIPEDGKPATGSLEEGIKFTNLPAEGEIYIYSVLGELVRKIEFNDADNGQKVWDGKNQNGQDVASGVYLWVVKTKQDKKTGKLIIIR